jgi:ubiquinone/menaquinone biosynthesis C-methylase UbiE
MENSIQKTINSYWDIAAPKYSQKIQGELNYGHKWLCNIMQFIPHNVSIDVLDIGISPEFLSIILGKAGQSVIAIDYSDQMLLEAVSNTKFAGVNVAYIKMDAHKLDFANNRFNLVISGNLTWTLHDPLAEYTEWKRVLQSKGKIMVFDANYGN